MTHEAVGGAAGLRARPGGAGAAGGGGGGRDGGAAGGARRHARGRADLLAQLGAEGLDAGRIGGLGHELEGALREGVDRAGAVGGENAETTTVGTAGPWPPSARRTPRPSRPGIARSSVMASGRSARHSASA